MERGVEPAGPDEGPDGVHPGLSRDRVVEGHLLQARPARSVVPLAEEALGLVAIVDVGALEESDQLGVGAFRQVEPEDAGRLAVADPVEPPLEAVDPGGVPVGVLIAVVAVVPVEDVERAVGPGLLDDGHEPGVVGPEEVALGLAEVGRAVFFEPVDVDPVAVDVAHVELAPVLLRVRGAVEVGDPAVGGLLVLVVDDRLQLPGERGVRAALPVVIAGLGQVPEVVDHAGAGEGVADLVEGDPPGVAGPFAEDLEVAGLRVDPEDGAGEFVDLAAMLDPGRVEDAVPAVEPAVRPPGQRVRQLVGVEPAEAGDDDLGLVRLAVAVGVLQEEDIGRVGDPDPAGADGDPRGDVQAFGEDRELVGPAVAVGVLQDLDPVPAGPGRPPGVFQALGHPDPPTLVEGHRDRVDDLRLARDQLDPEPGRHGHPRDRLRRRERRARRPVLGMRDRPGLLGRGGRGDQEKRTQQEDDPAKRCQPRGDLIKRTQAP